ncbi:MAG: hypothetical protein J5973_05305, partial [Eubacterium sp.]|nr:hypothetical protein [Eubacterium sp.]
MIPYGDMLVSFPAADAVRIKAHDTDGMRSKRYDAKEPKPERGCAADRPCREGLTNRRKGCIGPCDVLDRLQLLKLLKDGLPGSWEDRCFLNDHGLDFFPYRSWITSQSGICFLSAFQCVM